MCKGVQEEVILLMKDMSTSHPFALDCPGIFPLLPFLLLGADLSSWCQLETGLAADKTDSRQLLNRFALPLSACR